ncbi:AMP-binding protein [Garicola koreensis]|uniref:O-succinylbenzoic acid--CoA ligase n=1 Tax=Garicola koreensis TaxID=1262554 RepID=A0A7W5TV87_9MICC|nr:AMP-binding protein [Garicola koreensis]MBB3668388.1 O-succinylbenzoic acid--CoA ligase [Garicola koreensis]
MSWLAEALAAIDAARRADAPPVEFLPTEHDDDTHPHWTLREDAADSGAAAVVRTSGSTGTPKQTLLSWDALEASARMTAQALGGHGQWLLTLQPSYVAGLAVLTRSLVAATTPVALLQHTTDPHRFTEAAEQLTGQKRFASLVPTQLQRLLEHDDDPVLLDALRRFDAILLGGGATGAELYGRAKRLGLNVIRTYGMSETCGGCVYDGYPLPGVSISIGAQGRVQLAGPMLALGYLDDEQLTAEKFTTEAATGERRFRTDDLGSLSTEDADALDTVAQVSGAGHSTQIVPKLSVTGRVDDVITTGGVKVSAEQVRLALESHPRVGEAFVTGIDDAQWGQKVVAAVVLSSTSRRASTFAELDDLVRRQLGAAAVPKHYELLGSLPLLPNGKPDRQRLTDLLRR